MKSLKTTIDLIRHGEPEGGPKLRGSQDDPLSELGWSQMREATQNTQSWTKIVSSPLLRCQEFASELAHRHTLPLSIETGFHEIRFGDWEGLTTKELMRSQPEALGKYWQDPDAHTPPNGERQIDFLNRIQSAWEELIRTSEEEHTLLVCHGGVIRAILLTVLKMPSTTMWNIDVPYANVTRIVFYKTPEGTLIPQLKFHQAKFFA